MNVRFTEFRTSGTVPFHRGFRNRICFLGIVAVLSFSRVQAQEKADSLNVRMTKTKSPTVAMIRSALLPGWGQWYNDQKWKALLVFGGEVALVGNAVYYNQRVAKGTSDDERRFYRDVRGRFLWWFLAVHLLNVLDAYVDAHLWNFDTGPFLSLHQKTEDGNWVFVRLDWAF